MMEEAQRNELMKYEADRLRQKISRGQLFGKPVNMENVDEVIFAAYLYGKQEDALLRYEARTALMERTDNPNLNEPPRETGEAGR
jgi:hypothetical protein